MIPKHQAMVDAVLLAVQQRMLVLQRALRRGGTEVVAEMQVEKEGLNEREEQLKRLRRSVLGQRLRRIVAYVEGYPAEGEPVRRTVGVGFQAEERVQGGIREEVVQVCRVVYGKRGECWQFPRGWQHSALGKVLHAALVQFYREHLPEQLVGVAAAAKEIGIARQTLHEWIADGQVFPWMYEIERDVVWVDREEVKRLWSVQFHRLHEKTGE